MRLSILAFMCLPVAGFAEETIITLPEVNAAQSQSCPVGMTWNAESGACAMEAQSGRPTDMLGEPGGCASQHATREVTS